MQQLPTELPEAAKELGHLLYSQHCLAMDVAKLQTEVKRLQHALERIKQNTLCSNARGICDEHLGANERALEV